MVLSARDAGAFALAGATYAPPVRDGASYPWLASTPRSRAQIAASDAAGQGVLGGFLQPAVRAALAASGEDGAAAARLLGDAQAFERRVWRWALAQPESCRRALEQAGDIEAALSRPFAYFLDCMLGATPSAAYESLRVTIGQLRARPDHAIARADLLRRLESFTFVMMTGRPALRAARDWSLRAIGAELAAGADRAQPHGFHEFDAPAFDHGAPAGSPLAAWLDEPCVADWLVQAAPSRDEIAPRLALAAALRDRTPGRALEAAFEAAAARQALAEAADPDDLLEATRDVALTLGRVFIERAAARAGAPAADADDVAAFVRTFAALASHPIDGRALRAARTDVCDLAIRFRAHAAAGAQGRHVEMFHALYESGVATALAEIAMAHGCLRRLVQDETAADRVLAGALLLDRAGFAPCALRAGLALKRLCDAEGGTLSAAWSAASPHAAVARQALAPA